MIIGAYESGSEPPYPQSDPQSDQIGQDVEVCLKEKRRCDAVFWYSGGGTRTPDTRIMIFVSRVGPSLAYLSNVLTSNGLAQVYWIRCWAVSGRF